LLETISRKITMKTLSANDRQATKGELDLLDRYWRAANYLSVGQIYLLDNPLLQEPLLAEHIKPRLLGHWGTTPGLNFIYSHLNRLIRARDLNVIYVCGPGHGGPGMVANNLSRGHLQRDLSRHQP
jgi:xylulose-5-phosphate/fructose-6-phosphate phosphoketolase